MLNVDNNYKRYLSNLFVEVAKTFTFILLAIFLVVSVNAYDIDSIVCSETSECPIDMFCNENINFCEYRLKNGLTCSDDADCASRNCDGTCECKDDCYLSDRGFLEPLDIEYKLQSATPTKIEVESHCTANVLTIEAADGWKKSYDFNELDDDITQHYELDVNAQGESKVVNLLPKTDVVFTRSSSCAEPSFWDTLTSTEKIIALFLAFILLKILLRRR